MVDRNDSPQAGCKDFEPDLVLYYYGDCAETERRKVETHLETCASCRHFLEDLRRVLPLTVKPDAPPQLFWEGYSRELRGKLAGIEPEKSWREAILSSLRPWPVPAMATALVVILAVILTFNRGPQDLPPEAFLEILPLAENLEFFKTMELLDVMDVIEAMAGPGNGAA